MDIALALDILVPAAKYGGSLTAGTKASYDKLRWEDDRTKPSWGQIVSTQAQAEAEAARQHGLDHNDSLAFIAEDILHILLQNGTIGADDLDPGVVGLLASRRALRGKPS